MLFFVYKSCSNLLHKLSGLVDEPLDEAVVEEEQSDADHREHEVDAIAHADCLVVRCLFFKLIYFIFYFKKFLPYKLSERCPCPRSDSSTRIFWAAPDEPQTHLKFINFQSLDIF